MKLVQTLQVLLAQTTPSAGETPLYKHWWFVLLALLAVIIVSYAFGKFLSKRFRMVDYGWKVGLILSTVGCGLVFVVTGWPPKYGVDLKGGVTLIYEVKQPEDENQGIQINALVEALKRRINPAGTKEIVIRPYGSNQVEVIVPEVDQTEIEQLKRKLVTAGILKFRIVANRRAHGDWLFTQAEEPENLGGVWVYNADKQRIGVWVRVAREVEGTKKPYPLKVGISDGLIRDAKTKEILKDIPGGSAAQLSSQLEQRGIEDIDVLMVVPEHEDVDVQGDHLAVVRSSFDQRGNPSINFVMNSEGEIRMGNLTSENKGERLGIVFDNQLISAPTIQSTITRRGEITGQFTKQEVDELVSLLRAGRLPATLKEQPLSEDKIDSQLGRDMRTKGIYAIAVSLVVVLVFMVFYYRFSGAIACFALATNILLIVAMVILVKQPFTLTGLAGLVLTVGMSVDANVLVFERIREELARGAALRMAIRNGFARATTTIVDANLTTLITAIVLYTIGTDQIRGFSVALILGILMSMYTAIFCSRVIFDIAERRRWITKLSMMELIGTSKFDFIGKRRIAAAVSLLLIIVGLVAVFTRGKGIFAIDLAGGQSVRIVLNEPVDVGDVRKRLSKEFETLRSKVGKRIDFTVNEVDRTEDGLKRNTVFKIDASIPTPDPDAPKESDVELANVVRDLFGNNLARYSMDFKLVGEQVSHKKNDGAKPAQPVGNEGTRADLPPATVLALADDTDSDDSVSSDAAPPLAAPEGSKTEGSDTSSKGKESTNTKESSAAESTNGDQSKAGSPGELGPSKTPGASTQETGTATSGETGAPNGFQDEQVVFNLSLKYDITDETLHDQIKAKANELEITAFDPENPAAIKIEDIETSEPGFHKKLTLSGISAENAEKLLSNVKKDLETTPYFRGSSGVGSQIAGDTQKRAIAAMLASLICIIIYIWIRFQKVEFGLAAVVALVHDVLVVLGAIAVSAYVAVALGFLGVEEFKISLPVIAAFLTIIGYSLNDTIVVFDRIREVRGKSPELTSDMINRSIGQTLSRTLLTSLTTMIVVVILYGWGGPAIHGFAFALVVGVLVGTYSSIFVASPALLWMIGRGQSKENTA